METGEEEGDEEETSEDIKKKIAELDKLDEEFLLLKDEWDKLENGSVPEGEGREASEEKTVPKEKEVPVKKSGGGIFGIFNRFRRKKKTVKGKPTLPEKKPAPTEAPKEEEPAPKEAPKKVEMPIDKLPKDEAIKLLRGETPEKKPEDVVESPPEKKTVEEKTVKAEPIVLGKASKKEMLKEVLETLERRATDVKGSAIVTRDGLIISSKLPASLDLNAFGGLTASFFGAAETSLYEIKKAAIQDIYIESDETKVIAVVAGEYAFLVTMVLLNANIGIVLMEMKKAAAQIEEIMKS